MKQNNPDVCGCTKHPIENYVAYGKLSYLYNAFFTNLDSVKVLDSIQEALKSQVVEEEIRALESKNTWTLVKLPLGKIPIGCKWIFLVKCKADGSVERFKAKLVAIGFTQSYEIDYQETFAPVAKLNTVRNWPLYQLDIKNAFLNRDFEEEVYMTISSGLENKSNNNLFCKLKKSFYGLKQSPRAWFERFTKTMIANGYQQCQADHTLFVKSRIGGKKVILIVYVDDIILTGDDFEKIMNLKKKIVGNRI
ncbi:cysteine-rich RLK RECEPTOR-like protein kinase [Gossypium australe]|uniref:Cysteine-rich RLK RECEPTOR-like protein kinase n=1 Tax=Gossypium australe TaxID=47621 RepID=A0A5B6W892_9ROSI|nr:cysteine-rich RLK RECEPTOR-like protein kinase [Gossypium australe]